MREQHRAFLPARLPYHLPACTKTTLPAGQAENCAAYHYLPSL